jgi:RNA polymerase sigma factor (sigma-70 family)
MRELPDNELLQSFVRDASQRAFSSLARRYAGLVFHVAMRCSGSAELAEEAAQNAFLVLARKAARIDASNGLAPWLHRTVCFEAMKIRDRETRYRQKVARFAENPPGGIAEPASWEGTAPVLDSALNELSPQDRRVILHRFYEGLSYGDLVTRFGSEAATWRKRCNRALERLRAKLARRGALVSSVALTEALSALLPQSAPAAVVATLARPAAAAATGKGLGAMAGLFLMTHAKMIALAAAVLLITGTILSGVLSNKPLPEAVPAKSPVPFPAPKETAARATEPPAVTPFSAEERRVWLNAFRDHLYEPGAPHGQDLMPAIGGLGGRGGRGAGMLGRSPIHEFVDRAGGDASEVIGILKEALYADRATVAYRALGYWGWVREFSGEDGARTLIEFVGRTGTRNLAMYAMNILGQYESHYPADTAGRLADMILNGTQNAKIALSYYGPRFMNSEGMESLEEKLLPLLTNADAATRYAAGCMLAEIPARRGDDTLAAMLDVPPGLEDFHYKHMLSQLLEMPAEAVGTQRERLAAILSEMRSMPGATPSVIEALLKFQLAGDEETSLVNWKAEADALAARKGDETLTVPELIKAMENPVARPIAIEEIRRIGPNAHDFRDTLLALMEKFPDDEALAGAVYATDINVPHPSPWLDMRGMSAVLRGVDEALAASDDPAWVAFRHQLDVWMIDEPKTNFAVARGLADDLGDVSSALRELFIQGLRESAPELADRAFGKVAE